MPSRNKKNKNRAQPPNNTSAPKNVATPVQVSEDSATVREPEPNLKSAIDVAKEKLEQLQQSVNSIKASIAQPKKSDEKQSEPQTNADAIEQMAESAFETQTMKKKRNRNRNRNRNKHNQNADESGVSSTSGTNESSTHENSPTPAAVTAVILPATEVITSEIKEEPAQEEIQTVESEPSPPIEIKTEQKTDDPPILVQTKDEEIKEKVALTESAQSSSDIEKPPNENKESQNGKDAKENDKQKKNRQGKNANKNQKEKHVEAKPPESDKSAGNDVLDRTLTQTTKADQIEIKEDLTDAKHLSAENKPKTTKDNKKSPKLDKKNVQKIEEMKKDDMNVVEEQKIKVIEEKDTSATTSSTETKSDENKNDAMQGVEEPKVAIVESGPSTISDATLNVEQPVQAESLPSDKSPSENVLPQIQKEVKEEAADAKVKAKEESKKEVRTVESKQEVTESKPLELPVESGKENKKSKAKKSPPQAKKQIEQKPSPPAKGKQTQHVETPKATVQSEKKSENMDNAPKTEETMKSIVTPTITEKTSIDPLNETPTQTEVVKVNVPEENAKVEISIEKPKEQPETVSIEPTAKVEAKVEKLSCQKEEVASTSKPKVEDESNKLELPVGSDEGTKTPTTSPVLTPATEPAKQPIQQDDETAKIWKILEEASKSLEPVEIQMDDPVPPVVDSTPIEAIVPILCSQKDQTQVKESAQELVSLLETKETNKAKQTAPTKNQKENQQVKETNQQPKQSSPIKTAEVQPKKTSEPKKKEVKPAPKNVKSVNKPQQQPTEKPTVKIPDKTPEKTPPRTEIIAPDKIIPKSPAKPIEKTPPREESTGAVALADVEIPLDVSILPNEIEVAELNTESKNGPGSGFVPSVEQTAVETKSLVPETITKIEKTSEPRGKSKSKSRSPVNLKSETTAEVAVPSVPLQQNETLDVTKENGNTKPENLSPEPQATSSKSSSKSASPEKFGKPNNQNSKQKGATSKNVAGKGNQKVDNGKPAVPPRPENLGQTKRSPAAATKAKTEKILMLTGNIEDEDSEDDYIEYKFMPRQVFIATICQLCKKPTIASERILCQLCQMVSYCCGDHVKNDEPTHKDLCAALQEIAKKRGGHIYNNARILNNNDYRSLRVHTLNLCENFLKRPLQTFEREILLFPRLCSTPTCREWRQNLLTDCPNCTQVYFCTAQPDHLIETHTRWCNSVALYQKLVVTQSVSGRIEPSLPSRIQTKPYILPNTIGEVFKDLYKNISIIKDDCVFATLTQLATAPLTAYFATQKAEQNIGEKFTIHLIGAELQFEADVLDIWETFFLHLAHNLMELTIVFCGPELNAENIPLDIISRIRMCRTCRQNCRIVKFDFQCAKFYHDYAKSSAYTKPDLICFFNPGFHHVNSLNGMDTWSETIKIASTSGCPVVVTSYTEYESPRDLERFQMESTNGGKQMNLIHGPEFNRVSSHRPERNFISDEIVPLIFKNYFCFIMK